MREKTMIPYNTLKRFRGDLQYQIIMKDILSVFGYDENTNEYKKVQNLINGKPLTQGIEAQPEV